jgi:PAS domain S-box-containing protein
VSFLVADEARRIFRRDVGEQKASGWVPRQPRVEKEPRVASGALEEAIVDTVREPLIVLDEAMRVLIASRSFYSAFQVTKQEAEGRSLFELGNGQWNIASLRERLGKIIPDHATIEGFEVEHDFPIIGRRTMLLNARKVFYEGNGSTSLLVAIEDVTERHTLEREKDEFLCEKDELLRQNDLLLQDESSG